MASITAVTKTLSAFVALALAAFAVGCGGSETTAATLTKAQFVKQADAICLRGDERFQEMFQSFMQTTPDPALPSERTMAQWTEIVEKVFAPAVEQEVEEVRALGAPRDDRRQVNSMLAAVEEGLKEVEEDPSVEADTEEQFRKSSRLAGEYGLTFCGH